MMIEDDVNESNRHIRVGWNAFSLKIFWEILLFFLIFVGVTILEGVVLGALCPQVLGRFPATPGRFILYETLGAVAVLVATLIMSKWRNSSWLDYGWRGNGRIRLLLCGMLCGIAMVSILIALLKLSGVAIVDFGGLNVDVLWAALAWGVGFCLLALCEEAMFRGFIFYRMRSRIGGLAAGAISSVLFGLAHVANPGETSIGIFQVVVFGLVSSFAVIRTGSLAWSIGFHATWDWSQSFLFGTRDSGLVTKGSLLLTRPVGPAWLSGGSAGPEGSVLVLLILAMIAVLIEFGLPRIQPRQEAGPM
jgi:hypothetical protein